MAKRILSVVTNVSHYEDPSEPTGLWLSELTHAHDVFAEAGYEQTIVSPTGGPSPLEPRSLKFPNYGATE
jgi:putative intracellular protease/amidase